MVEVNHQKEEILKQNIKYKERSNNIIKKLKNKQIKWKLLALNIKVKIYSHNLENPDRDVLPNIFPFKNQMLLDIKKTMPQ